MLQTILWRRPTNDLSRTEDSQPTIWIISQKRDPIPPKDKLEKGDHILPILKVGDGVFQMSQEGRKEGWATRTGKAF